VNRVTTAATVACAGVLAAHLLPAATCWPALRAHLLPGLAGVGDTGHVALTFDDGPHPRSTPFFLRELDRHGVRATFFVLGAELARTPRLGREMAAAGHEIAVHGWHHHRLPRYGPRRTHDELARTRDLITSTTGTPPTWFRPTYGMVTTSALLAARRLDLTPVLWTNWGWDRPGRSTPDSVFATVTRSLAGGGTVMLHDSDAAAPVGAWRSALGALPHLLDECARRGWTVGPLGEHGVPGTTPRPTTVRLTPVHVPTASRPVDTYTM
jgi:peptidoglycan/xylan/chitin deacetylase (PgdA/CDA1 family)